MEKKFKVLRFIAAVHKILGIITAVLTVIGAVGICLTSILGGAIFDRIQTELGNLGPVGVMGGAAGGAIVGGFLLIWGTIVAVVLLAAGEGIFLLLALEENTRTTADCMQQFSLAQYPAQTDPTEPYTPQA
ncbi:MAG: hypothetical protein MUQ10_18790 [Anaerolineae bacterium]|nr:hypothetical protein [Anaerolineae bacterium]